MGEDIHIMYHIIGKRLRFAWYPLIMNESAWYSLRKMMYLWPTFSLTVKSGLSKYQEKSSDGLNSRSNILSWITRMPIRRNEAPLSSMNSENKKTKMVPTKYKFYYPVRDKTVAFLLCVP